MNNSKPTLEIRRKKKSYWFPFFLTSFLVRANSVELENEKKTEKFVTTKEDLYATDMRGTAHFTEKYGLRKI